MKIFRLRFLFTLSIVVILVSETRAQNASYYDIMHDMGLIQQNFNADSGTYVNCSMSYLYSMESTPLKFIDSLQGQYKAAGSLRYVRIAHTESIQNDSVNLTLYNDDKVMLAAAKRKRDKTQMGQAGLMINNMDSVFIATNADSVKITQRANQKIMTIYFTASSPYYKGTLIYDATTYVPFSLSYILRQTKIGESGQPAPDGNLITVRFTGYSKSAFDASSMNVNNYIQIDATGKATSQAAFRAYNLIQQGQLTTNTTISSSSSN